MYKATGLLQEDDRKLFEVAKSVGYDSDAAFSKAFKRVLGMAPKNIGEVPHRRVEVEAAMSFLSGWSLALIGNASGKLLGWSRGSRIRGVFDEETRTKPLAFAAGRGALWDLNASGLPSRLT